MSHGTTILKKIDGVMADINSKGRMIIWPALLFSLLMIFVLALSFIVQKNNKIFIQKRLDSLAINLEKTFITNVNKLNLPSHQLTLNEHLKNEVLTLRNYINVERFLVLIKMDNHLVLTTQDSVDTVNTTFQSVREFNLLDHHFKITVVPTSGWLQDNISTVPSYTFVIGSIFAFLVTMLFFLAEKIRRDSYTSAFIMRRLEGEIKNQNRTQKELKALHRMFDLATYTGQIGVWDWHLKEDKLIWNKTMYEIYGVPPDVTPSYEVWRNTLVKEDLIHVEDLLTRAMKGEVVFNTTFCIKRPSGELSYIFAAGQIEWDKKGNPIRFIGINNDITQTKKTEEILSSANMGTWEWDLEQDEFHLSSNLLTMLGYDIKKYSKISAAKWRALIHPEDLEMYQLLLQKHFTKETFFYESEYRIKDNFQRWVWVNDRGKILSRNPKNQPITMSGIYFDISERKKIEESTRYLANHDELTNLSSRHLAVSELKKSIQQSLENHEIFAVLFIDIDNFKQVNDTFGHDIGDKVIKEFSERLVFCVRESDFIARMGGDEFLAILKDVKSEPNSIRIGQQMVRILSQPYSFDTHMIDVSASIGLALFPQDGKEVAVLLKQADEAMYTVKNNNKNNVMCFSELKHKRLHKPQH